jgi:hypothetical protein
MSDLSEIIRPSLKNKFKILLIPMMITIILLSGCTEEIGQIIDDLTIKNSRPVGIISAPENGYFGERLVFDASNSYDLDGEIIQYLWDFGDGKTAEGKSVVHYYEFENNYNINYPLIFQVSLIVKDDNESITGTNHQIKLFPSSYNF